MENKRRNTSISLIQVSLRIIPFLFFTAICGYSWGQVEDDWGGEIEEFPVPVGALKISEVMFNPAGEGKDYVEVYNAYPETFVSDSFCLVRWIGDSLGKRHPFPPGVRIPTGCYIALTTDTAFVLNNFHVAHPERLLRMASMPPYPNAQGTVLVYSLGGTLQDRFDYNADMHSPLLRNVENVALERADLDGETNNPDNWHSASSAAKYGTPTAENSQGKASHNLSIELSSDLLSPDGDGYQDELEITVFAPLPSLSACITILDAHGRTVRRLMRNGVLCTHEILVWDGLDESHKACPRGTYIILFEVYNREGYHSAQRKTVSVVY